MRSRTLAQHLVELFPQQPPNLRAPAAPFFHEEPFAPPILLNHGAALVVFHIPFRGSALLLPGCACIYLLTALGVGAEVLRPQMLALLVHGVVVLGTSALRFHKRLD